MTTSDDGLPPLPPGVKRVWKVLRNGTRKPYHYHRATGLPLDGEIGSLRFMTAYREAERQATRPRAPEREAFTSLLEEFLRSPEHKGMAPATRHNHRKFIDLMRARFAHLHVGDLNLREVKGEFYEWRDEMSATPATADLGIAILRRVLGWAEERGKIEFNRAAGVKKIVQAGRNRSQITWTVEEREALLEASDEGLRNAILLDRYTAAREADLVRLERPMIDESGWLSFTPQKTARKTGVVVCLPTFALQPLAELLERLPREGLLLPSQRGEPWDANSLRTRFWYVRTKVFGKGFGKTFHDLRGTTATDLQDAGCTEPEIASILGWAVGGEVPMSKNYLKRTRQLALNAYNKWQAAAFTEKGVVVPLRRG
jgi:integrase